MRKSIILLCSLLFAVQFATAQQTLYVIDKDGKLSAYSAATVSFSDDVFSFTNGDVTEVTKESFSASFQVAFKSNEIKSIEQTLEVGVCFSDIHASPTIQDGKRSLGTSLTSYTFGIYGLESGTTYYWRPYVKLGNAVCYGEISEETTLGKKLSYKIIDGHKFVDLGLPSGLLWATTNIGAETAADNGNYYAWGETTTKSNYTWSTYKYGTSTSNITKYNSTDGKTILDKEDDAAYVNWGSSCRMPTEAEFGELLDTCNCTWTWTSTKNSSGISINGYKVTNKKNGNSIFLPASGGRFGDDLYDHGSYGDYWSSTLLTSNVFYACCLDFYSSYRRTDNYYRYRGLTVRPVAELPESHDGQTTQSSQPTNSQQNMWVVSENGKANVVEVSSINFATFHADNWLHITDDGIDAKATNSISASCTIALATGGEVKSLGVTPEVGVCYSKENSLPTVNDDCQTLGPSLKSYSFTLSSLISGTTYYYRVYIKLNNGVFYGDVVKVKTLGTKPNDKVINGHKFLDLGLPSGLLWAETNIGAETAADDGNYYAWGETTTKSDYSWDTYKYGTSESDITKYNSTDGNTILDKDDDVAYVNWGSSCRMPTEAEFSELLNSDNCIWTWTNQPNSSGSSVNGYKVTSKKNGNSIFLPASGECYGDDRSGFYWSSSLRTSSVDLAYCLHFYGSGGTGRSSRYFGRPVRPVAEP